MTNEPEYLLCLTRESFDRSCPNLASKAMRLLSASLAFSSAEMKNTMLSDESESEKVNEKNNFNTNSPILAR